MLYNFCRQLVRFYIFLKFKKHVLHIDKIPENSIKGGFIVASNHQNYYDVLIIAAMIPGKFSFMAKSELFEKNILFGWLIKLCGAFPVRRGEKDSGAIERAVSDIKSGRVLVIFPEGKRSSTGIIGRAKTGIALIAEKASVPVLPVCIVYGLGGNKKRIDFAVGDIIPISEIKNENNNLKNSDSSRAVLKEISSRIMESIKFLQKEIYAAAGVLLNE